MDLITKFFTSLTSGGFVVTRGGGKPANYEATSTSTINKLQSFRTSVDLSLLKYYEVKYIKSTEN